MKTLKTKKDGADGLTRRDLIKAAGAFGLFNLVPSGVLWGATAPSNQLTRALIGFGVIAHTKNHLSQTSSRLVGLCDPFSWRVEEGLRCAETKGWGKVKAYENFMKILEIPGDLPSPERVERLAMGKVGERLAHGRGKLPGLVFFNDDFIASGALKAMSAAGLRIPEDVRVAAWANAGSGPVWPAPLDLIRMDPKSHGDKIADGVLACLDGAEFPADLRRSAEFVPAEADA